MFMETANIAVEALDMHFLVSAPLVLSMDRPADERERSQHQNSHACFAKTHFSATTRSKQLAPRACLHCRRRRFFDGACGQ